MKYHFTAQSLNFTFDYNLNSKEFNLGFGFGIDGSCEVGFSFKIDDEAFFKFDYFLIYL